MKNATYLSRRSRRLLGAVVVGLVLVAASSSLALSAPPSPPAGEEVEEYIKVYSHDCATTKIFYAPGDKVCVEAGNFFPLNIRPRRFQWVAPDGRVVELKDISADPQFDIVELPESGEFAQAGKWTVRTIGRTAAVKTRGSFNVRKPFSAVIDLGIIFEIPELVLPLERLDYELHIANEGPDDGLEIEFVTEVPTNMTFVGMRQLSGPEFACDTPKEGGTGTITCKSKSLALDEVADFRIYFQVNAEVREGELCRAASRITGSLPDSNEWNNSTETVVAVGSPER